VPEFNAHLWVEGKNELHVISHLCEYHHVPESFDILEPQINGQGSGIETTLNSFRLNIQESGKQAVGLVIDADEHIDRRWQQVIDIIRRVNRGYVLPKIPDPQGTLIPAPNDYSPRLGVWLMPDNQQKGMLEDFAAFLIPVSDQLRPFAHKILDEIETAKLNYYRRQHRSKANVHTWLAWQENPGMPMGQAITAKALSATSPIAVAFVAWLNRLFNPQA